MSSPRSSLRRFDFSRASADTGVSSSLEIGQFALTTLGRSSGVIDPRSPAVSDSHTKPTSTNHERCTDRSMPARDLHGDLSRLHPSPGPSAVDRSIDNEADTLNFRSPSSPSIEPSRTLVCSFSLCRVFALDPANRSIDRLTDRPIDRRITITRAQVRADTCARAERKVENTWASAPPARSMRSIDLEHDRRGVLHADLSCRPGRRHRASATAALLSNLLAGSERVNERTRE